MKHRAPSRSLTRPLFVTACLGLLFWILAGGTCALAEPPPNAAEQEARSHFESGKAAYQAGQYELALAEFQRSFELSHKPQLQYNLGLSYDRLRRDGEALEAFEAYLNWEPNGERSAEVQARVAALKRAIGARMVGPTTATDKPDASSPPPAHDDRGRRKRLWWIIGGTAVAVIVVGITVGVLASNSDGERPREPNTGIRVEALSWR